jgi:hypothetical protein
MDGAQFYSLRVGEAGGGPGRNKMQVEQNKEESRDVCEPTHRKKRDEWGTVSFPAGRAAQKDSGDYVMNFGDRHLVHVLDGAK